MISDFFFFLKFPTNMGREGEKLPSLLLTSMKGWIYTKEKAELNKQEKQKQVKFVAGESLYFKGGCEAEINTPCLIGSIAKIIVPAMQSQGFILHCFFNKWVG